jgi:probable phosphoglycerate mutase
VKKIYIVRHGAIDLPSVHSLVGQLDLPLSDKGKGQVEELARLFRNANIDRLVSSPLLRCRESAAIIGGLIGRQPEIDISFREINLGEWEGLSREQIEARFPGEYEMRGRSIASYRPMGGESFNDLEARVWPAFLRLFDDQAERIVLVAHAGVNRVLLCRLLGMPLPSLFSLRQDYACLNIVNRQAGSLFHLELMNFHADAS